MPSPQHGTNALTQICHRALLRVISEGSLHYERKRHLPRLLPREHLRLDEPDSAATLSIARALRAALARERRLGRQGDWRYDLNRHIGLRQALWAELRYLRCQLTDETGAPPPPHGPHGPQDADLAGKRR